MQSVSPRPTMSRYMPDFYNELMEVDEVNATLRARGFFNEDISALRRIFKAHGIADRVGVVLLHNHCFVRGDEAMVQSRKGERLVTSPRKVTKNWFRSSVPSTFAVDGREGDALVPIEFSNDPIVATDHVELMRQSVFLKEFIDFIIDRELNRLIGLTLLRRAWEAATTSNILVETTQPATRQNIVEWRFIGDVNDQKMIQTVYSFSSDVAAETRCEVRCINSSYCVARSPGHARETSHGRQHRRITIL
jgi:hypothetical protein